MVLCTTRIVSAFGPQAYRPTTATSKAPAATPVFSLTPLASCGADAICYESESEADLTLARKLNPFACKDLLLRPGSCSLYAFPQRVGPAPFNQKVTRYSAPGNHLWFYLINQLVPGGSVTGGRCGEVDAASRMPAALFNKKNAKELEMYIQATNKAYGTKLGRCTDATQVVYKSRDDTGTTVSANFTQYQGANTRVSWAGADGIVRKTSFVARVERLP